MHRTTTTAALLATVAVSALSGCVTVQRPPAPGPPQGSAPSQAPVPRPDGSAQPRAVQAPVREALEMVGPSRHPQQRTSPAPRPPVDPPTTRQPPSRVQPPPHPHPRPHRRRPPEQPHIEVPDFSRTAPKSPDVCALGRKYGGWRPDSPEATICEQAYRR
ncbi:hypothetical protein [Streptomyces sp. NPDC001843]|uniref:hypothetical protein n=1 Tax=Streptomyces sp. NPDC001843 TaxID=3364617 RepID=UPI0036D0C16D